MCVCVCVCVGGVSKEMGVTLHYILAAGKMFVQSCEGFGCGDYNVFLILFLLAYIKWRGYVQYWWISS